MGANHLLRGLAGVGLALGVASGPAPQVFRGRVDVVSANVSVRDGNKLVTGLGTGNFVLTDNGVPQQIEAVSNEAVPVDLTIVVDVSQEAVAHRRIAEFRSDVQQIGALLKRADRLQVLAAGTYVKAIVPLQPVSDAWSLDALPQGGGLSNVDATAMALIQPAETDRRQVIVVFTEALDTFSTIPRQALPAIAKRSDALLQIVLAKTWTGGVGRGNYGLPSSAMAFVEAAQITGGDGIPLGGGVVDAVKNVLQSFAQSYVLRYSPRGVDPSGWHELSIRVTGTRGSNYRVRARRGYFGG
ncbi:MAG TPA: hypothetical protein VJN96_20460 [Vicinamibacterales bacterium]|nr:hypothetical protein [Vicinamibacterales bacterium]